MKIPNLEALCQEVEDESEDRLLLALIKVWEFITDHEHMGFHEITAEKVLALMRESYGLEWGAPVNLFVQLSKAYAEHGYFMGKRVNTQEPGRNVSVFMIGPLKEVLHNVWLCDIAPRPKLETPTPDDSYAQITGNN